MEPSQPSNRKDQEERWKCFACGKEGHMWCDNIFQPLIERFQVYFAQQDEERRSRREKLKSTNISSAAFAHGPAARSRHREIDKSQGSILSSSDLTDVQPISTTVISHDNVIQSISTIDTHNDNAQSITTIISTRQGNNGPHSPAPARLETAATLSTQVHSELDQKTKTVSSNVANFTPGIDNNSTTTTTNSRQSATTKPPLSSSSTPSVLFSARDLPQSVSPTADTEPPLSKRPALLLPPLIHSAPPQRQPQQQPQQHGARPVLLPGPSHSSWHSQSSSPALLEHPHQSSPLLSSSPPAPSAVSGSDLSAAPSTARRNPILSLLDLPLLPLPTPAKPPPLLPPPDADKRRCLLPVPTTPVESALLPSLSPPAQRHPSNSSLLPTPTSNPTLLPTPSETQDCRIPRKSPVRASSNPFGLLISPGRANSYDVDMRPGRNPKPKIVTEGEKVELDSSSRNENMIGNDTEEVENSATSAVEEEDVSSIMNDQVRQAIENGRAKDKKRMEGPPYSWYLSSSSGSSMPGQWKCTVCNDIFIYNVESPRFHSTNNYKHKLIMIMGMLTTAAIANSSLNQYPWLITFVSDSAGQKLPPSVAATRANADGLFISYVCSMCGKCQTFNPRELYMEKIEMTLAQHSASKLHNFKDTIIKTSFERHYPWASFTHGYFRDEYAIQWECKLCKKSEFHRQPDKSLTVVERALREHNQTDKHASNVAVTVDFPWLKIDPSGSKIFCVICNDKELFDSTKVSDFAGAKDMGRVTSPASKRIFIRHTWARRHMEAIGKTTDETMAGAMDVCKRYPWLGLVPNDESDTDGGGSGGGRATKDPTMFRDWSSGHCVYCSVSVLLSSLDQHAAGKQHVILSHIKDGSLQEKYPWLEIKTGPVKYKPTFSCTVCCYSFLSISSETEFETHANSKDHILSLTHGENPRSQSATTTREASPAAGTTDSAAVNMENEKEEKLLTGATVSAHAGRDKAVEPSSGSATKSQTGSSTTSALAASTSGGATARSYGDQSVPE